MHRSFIGPARVVNFILSLWLFVSAFAWPHAVPQRTNNCILGVLSVVIALSAMKMPPIRFLNTGLGLWLFISAFVLPQTSLATQWNDAIIGVVIFFFSMISPEIDILGESRLHAADRGTPHQPWTA